MGRNNEIGKEYAGEIGEQHVENRKLSDFHWEMHFPRRYNEILKLKASVRKKMRGKKWQIWKKNKKKWLIYSAKY